MTSRKVLDINYQLLPGTDRKTTDIIIERNGAIAVRPTRNLLPNQIDELVKSKRMWIYRNLAEWKDLNATAVVREWVNGETFLYLGSTYKLSIVSNQKEDLLLKNGRFSLKRELIELGGPSAARLAFEKFYILRGTEKIKERIDRYTEKVGVKITDFVVKDLNYRWAYFGKNNNLAFHWKCMMAPIKIIDYIVVHELCHSFQSNHNDQFWNEVDKVMPDYLERKNWLKKYGAGLDI